MSDLQKSNAKIDHDSLQRAISKICETEIHLKENIQLSDLLELKMAVSPINNLITKELTRAFINRLFKWDKISEAQRNAAIELLETTNANANGYDFVMESPQIVAEVKGNIPCNREGTRYGANQKKEIVKDLIGLKEGKKKGGDLPLNEYVKFMVMLDTHGAYEAMKNLTKGMTDIKLVAEKVDIDMGDAQTIYVLFISV